MNEFNVGDTVDVFVADYFHCVSPTELQPMYIDFRGDDLEVPGGTGWIQGIIKEIVPKGGDILCECYDIDFIQIPSGMATGAFVPIEYIRYGSGSVKTG